MSIQKKIACFGSNTQGQLNIPHNFEDGYALIIAAGAGHICMSKAGYAKCFGQNSDGQLNIPLDFEEGSATIVAAGG